MKPAERKDEKLELVHKALQQLLEERKQRGENDEVEGDEEDDLLLSKLLSQLESLEKDATTAELPIDSAAKQEASSVSSRIRAQECGTKEMNKDDLVKELRRIRKQNFITHCLLSVMIVVTAAWQLGEVSVLLAVRDKFRHPLRTLRDMVKGAIKGNNKASVLPEIEAPSLPSISVPEMSLLTLSNDDSQ